MDDETRNAIQQVRSEMADQVVSLRAQLFAYRLALFALVETHVDRTELLANYDAQVAQLLPRIHREISQPVVIASYTEEVARVRQLLASPKVR